MAEHADAHGSPSSISASGPPQANAASTTTPSSATAGAPGPALNPRSCVTCRRRKVRCDKRYPCANCQKAHIDCIFPAPGRAPRRPRKPPDGELLARLRRLEGVVQSLGVQVDDEEPDPLPELDRTNTNGAQVKPEYGVDTEVKADIRPESLNESFGRLVVDDKGRSRYVNNRFWAALSNEVEDLKQILNTDEESEEEIDAPSPMTDTIGSPGTYNYLFNGNIGHVDLQSQHPPAHIIREFWQAHLDYYDPLMRLFHIPTTQKVILELAANPSKASKSEETLLFAIYFAAVSALPPDVTQQKTGETREALQKKYRQATEQALARSHLLFTEEMNLLQAFVLYMYTIRRFDDSRVIWSLCGLACRIAITMGLHRDGSNFAISPLDVEIRRRLWWQILTLDIRASEYHGWDPVIVQHAFDTKFPLNVEDEDVTAATSTPPPEREGITSISFCIARYHTAMLYAKLHTRPSTAFDSVINSMRSRPGERRIGITLQEREKWIHDCQDQLEAKFFRYCSDQDPNHWLAATLTRMIFSKQWLSLLHPYLRLDRGASLSRATRERIFTISLESIEYALLIHEQCKRVKWGWVFQNWSQFHALASLLSELRVRTAGPLVDRAWRAVDATVKHFGQKNGDGKNGHTLWKPIRKLYDTAKADREHALAMADTDEEDSDGELDDTEMSQMKTEDYDSTAPESVASAAFSRTNSLLVEQNVPAMPPLRSNSYYVNNDQKQTSFPQQSSQQPQRQQQQPYNPLHPQSQQQWPAAEPSLSNNNNNNTNNYWYYSANIAMPSVQSVNPWGPLASANAVSQTTSGMPATSYTGAEQQSYHDVDPMLAGFGGPEDFSMQWNEWDEMMREFEAQPIIQGLPPAPPGGANAAAGMGRGPNNGAAGGAPGHRGNMLGETWM